MEAKIQKIREELQEERRQTLIRLEELDKKNSPSAEEIAYFHQEKEHIEAEVREFGEHIGLSQDTIDFIVKTQVRPGGWFGHDSGSDYVEKYLELKKDQFYSKM